MPAICSFFFFFNDTATTEIYTLSLHDALPIFEALLALPWALPGTVFAIALAITFSVHAPLQLRFVLVGTAVILPLAFLVRALPLTGRGILAAYRQLDPSLEEAAASLGAGRWRTLARVTLPQLR